MVFRRRALVRGAMVGGAAYYAGRKVAQGDQREYEQQERIAALEAQQAYQPPPPAPAYAPPPPQAPTKPVSEQLTELKALLDAGVLTQAEFDEQKAKVLHG
jgi:hypothetical protein